MASEVKSIHALLPVISAEVGAVGKDEVNKGQGFRFRGIDAVTKAVHPVLAKHGVGIIPVVESVEYETVEVGAKRTPMVSCRIVLSVTFYGPAGDTLVTKVAAESMDSGDKATAKAHSVALRTALLQTLLLPTDEPDPDHDVYHRSPQLRGEAADAEALHLAELIAGATTLEELRAVWSPILTLPEDHQATLKARVLEKRTELEGQS